MHDGMNLVQIIKVLSGFLTVFINKQDAQLSQRDRAAGCVIHSLQFSPKVEH